MVINSNLAYKYSNPEIFKPINEKNLKWCSVSLSDVISTGKRLDAQKYDISLRLAQTIILNNKFGVNYIIGKTIDKATEENVDILLFPEMLGNDEMSKKYSKKTN